MGAAWLEELQPAFRREFAARRGELVSPRQPPGPEVGLPGLSKSVTAQGALPGTDPAGWPWGAGWRCAERDACGAGSCRAPVVPRLPSVALASGREPVAGLGQPWDGSAASSGLASGRSWAGGTVTG